MQTNKKTEYAYTVTRQGVKTEKQAFEAGEGVSRWAEERELVENLGVYVKYIDLEHAVQLSKISATGLMRRLITMTHHAPDYYYKGIPPHAHAN